MSEGRPRAGRILVTAVALVLVGCGASSPSSVPTTVTRPPSTNDPSTALPTATVSVASPAPSAAAPGSSSVPTEAADFAPGSLPATGGGGSVQLTPGGAGDLYVLVGGVLARLGRDGRPLPGWPIDLGAYCLMAPTTAPDGSVRLACRGVGPGHADAPPGEMDAVDDFSWAVAPDARALAGWPLDRTGESPTLVASDLFLLEAADTDDDIRFHLTRVSPRGRVDTGTPFVTSGESDWRVQVGADGRGYLLRAEDERGHTVIDAFDTGGQVAGWSIDVAGWSSDLAFSAEGRIHLTLGDRETSASRVLAFDRDGVAIPGWSAVIPLETTWTYEGAGPVGGPSPPLVGPDGTVFFVTEVDGTAAYALDPTGGVLPGWPHRSSLGLVWSSDAFPEDCEPNETGCVFHRSNPAVGPEDVLFLLHPARKASAGGSIEAIGRNGNVVPGWPVTLTRPGAEFWSVVVGPDGTAYALAYEPEGTRGRSATVLGIAPDSTVRYVTTVFEP